MNTLQLLTGWFQFPVGEGAFFAVFGFAFVFFGILLLILILMGVGKIMTKVNGKKMKNVAPVQPIVPQEKIERVSPEVVAAITAALMAYYQEESKCDFVVRRIKKI